MSTAVALRPWRTMHTLVVAVLVVAACETQECPDPDPNVRADTFWPARTMDEACVVASVEAGEVTMACDVFNGEPTLLGTDDLRPAPSSLPFTPGQGIRLRAWIDDEYGSTYRLAVDDAETGRPLLRHVHRDWVSGDDYEGAPLDPFTFSEPLACRPVPGTRGVGDVRLAFAVTRGDETIRVHDGSTARLGEYTIWVDESTDHDMRVAILYTP